MMKIYNFNPGPAHLPREILQKAQAELLDYQGLGYSILEMSHRSPAFEALLDSADKAEGIRAFQEKRKAKFSGT